MQETVTLRVNGRLIEDDVFCSAEIFVSPFSQWNSEFKHSVIMKTVVSDPLFIRDSSWFWLSVFGKEQTLIVKCLLSMWLLS